MKLNTNVYIKDIWIPASQAMKKHFANENTFQQDGALSHTSRKTQAWCRANFPNFWSKEMWPPASPDLNSLDFNNIVEGLKVSLKKAWAEIQQEKLCVSVESFRGRLERVVKAKGEHIEI